MTIASKASINKPSILLVAAVVAILSSVSPLSAAPMIFAETTSSNTVSSSSISSSSSTMSSQNNYASSSMSSRSMALTNNVSSSSISINNTGMMVLNLGTPLFIENDKAINTTNITQNVSNATFEGNGTFMLPPTRGGNVSVTSSGYRVTNTTEGLARADGQVFIKTMDGKESATFPFARFTPINSTIGVGMAYLRTNSTTNATMGQQQLTSLNNTLMIYRDEAISPTQHTAIFWKWSPVSSSSSQATSSISENMSSSRPSLAMLFHLSNASQSSSSISINNTGMMVLNLGTPLFIEHGKTTSMTNIDQYITRSTFEGNGSFMLPTGRNVSTIDSGYTLRNSTGGLGRSNGELLLKTTDGKESALLTIASFRPANSTIGIGIAHIKTNSTDTMGQQQLASFNNTLGVYQNEDTSQTGYIVTLWKWK